ncbi:MAG: hypothetical protein OJF60_002891 [Burkholderiaceae bacterium]|nr:MAG: hypothetical protein OJF60_002891 [Burkholderiaceae bacterium]
MLYLLGWVSMGDALCCGLPCIRLSGFPEAILHPDRKRAQLCIKLRA